jgi:3',5'-cyclic AMP phosphodiesterase CpdA
MLRVAVIGDLHVFDAISAGRLPGSSLLPAAVGGAGDADRYQTFTERVLPLLLTEVAATRPDVVLHTGDLAEHGDQEPAGAGTERRHARLALARRSAAVVPRQPRWQPGLARPFFTDRFYAEKVPPSASRGCRRSHSRPCVPSAAALRAVSCCPPPERSPTA